MNRRVLLATIGTGAIGTSAGCVALGERKRNGGTAERASSDQNLGDSDGGLDVNFELTEWDRTTAEIAPDDPPVVNAPTGSCVGQQCIEMDIEGMVTYGSSNCATLDLAYAEYHDGPGQLSVLVAPTNAPDMPDGCFDSLGYTGYHIDATLDGSDIDLGTVVVTEHHYTGETYSSTVYFEPDIKNTR
jgi:hypothetical protein